MAKRVFELARELGVTSKAVLQKCRAEGIEVKNHMSALSAGLTATIREWFSEGQGGGTAVETTEHVDVAKERRKAAAQRRRRRKKAADEAAAAEAAQAVAEAPAAEPAQAAPTPAETPPTEAPTEVQPPPAAVEAPPPVAEAAAQAPEAQVQAAEPSAAPTAPAGAPAPVAQAAPPAEAPPEVPAEAPSQPAVPEEVEAPAEPKEEKKEEEKPSKPPLGVAVPNKPRKPEVIKPAGPQVVPAPAKLQGPRVVRFEGIEVGEGARRPPLGGRGPAPVGAPPGKGRGEERRTRRTKRRSPRRKGGRSVVEAGEGVREWRDRDLAERSERLAAATGGTLRRHRASVAGKGAIRPAQRTGRAEIEEPITVKSLSAATGIKIGDIIKRLMGQGMLATINTTLDRDTAEMIALEHDIELKVKVAKSAEEVLEEALAAREPGELVPRAPVVTFLGHVDHGKTSLLDRIRNARVAEGEEGGITQHIGSYRYDVGDVHVVFLDTPGHEAFTAMRARGANMTDVVVLVVAADDGVMPQTVEAINHAKAAGVPIIVALNKIDLPNANVQRALGQLAEHGLQPREWGGQTEVVRTSAVTGEGIDELVELLSLEAEVLELKADPTAPATGWVIEAKVDPTQGTLAQLLVRDGTLHVGDVLLAGRAYGRVRSIHDDRGRSMTEAGPSTPVLVAGLDELPDAGDRFCVVDDLARARQVAEERRERQRAEALAAAATPARLEDLFARIQAGDLPELRLVVKADVQGSLEALLSSIPKQATEEVRVEVLHSGVGGITEADVLLAEASNAVVLGFRVVPDQRAKALAEEKGVDIRLYTVIYQLLEDLEQAVKGLLAPTLVEEVAGRAEVRRVFKISRVGTVAGCYVTEGVITRGSQVRIIRDNVVVEADRQVESLRREKDDVREVRAGMECGLKVAGYDDVKEGDVIEAYRMVEVAR